MGTHADLMKVAEGIAAAALREVNPETSRAPAHAAAHAGELAAHAKVALEAAALAQNTGPGEIDEALAAIQEQLAEAGMLEASLESPVEFLRYTVRAVAGWRDEAVHLAAEVEAFNRLHDLAVGLERDFTAAGTDTSLRIAARIHAALEDVAAAQPNDQEG